MANKFVATLMRGVCFYLGATVLVIMMVAVFRDEVSVSVKQSSTVGSSRQNIELISRVHVRRTTTSLPLILIPDPVRFEDLGSIKDYHAEERRWCLDRIAAATNRSQSSSNSSVRGPVNWCPCVPPDLQGRVIVRKADDSNWTAIEEEVGSDMLNGGEWRPTGCVPHSRLALIIPCRDRESHLRVLLRHIVPILKRQLHHFRIFVVDQRLPMVFNKAATMNVGFLEAQKRFPFDCAVFHDVDMLLEDDRTLMTCGPTPRHYARSLDKFGYGLYPTFGGVVSMSAEQFRKVNGYSIKYFGWGGEDDDMWSRVGQLWQIYAPPATLSRYSTIFHSEDATNKRNPRRHALMDVGFERNRNRTFDGLSDLVYAVNDVELNPIFTRIQADLNTSALYYPGHRTFRYSRVAGFCDDSDAIVVSRGVSWASCRYLCDTLSDQPCFGFSHVPGRCTLIRNGCRLSAGAGRWTYVKDTQLSQTSQEIWK